MKRITLISSKEYWEEYLYWNRKNNISDDITVKEITDRIEEITNIIREEQTEVNELDLGVVSASVCYNIECPFDCYKDNKCLDSTTCTARKTVC